MTTCSLHGCMKPRFQRNGFVHDFCGRSHAKVVYGDRLRRPHGPCHLCQLGGCKKEVYFDEATQTVHDFCSRRHANLAIANGQWPPPSSQGSFTCKLSECRKAVHRDPVTGEESEYCSLSHAAQGRSRECLHPRCNWLAWLDPVTQVSLGYCGSRCAAASGLANLVGKAQCSLPGCLLETFLHPHTSEDLGYCCDDHRTRAAVRQLGPNTEPYVDRTFRGGPGQNDFQLKVLTNRHTAYASLKEQFVDKWKKQVEALTVERIFEVQVPTAVYKRHKEYAQRINNTRRRFHGTSCSAFCNFFVDLKGGPCKERGCNVCSICIEGFKLQANLGRTAQMTNFRLRYGKGLYFSSVSGKANDYAVMSEKTMRLQPGPHGKKWRCMFTASVAVGKPFVTQKGELPNSRCPPTGFDSVIGQVGPNLNYDEVCVYNEEAALPSYLIVYSMK